MKPDTHEVRRRRRPRRRLIALSPRSRSHTSRTLGLTACAPSPPPPPPLSHSLTLYPPSPSVPDRSRPDFMNCKRTVASPSPSSFAPCTPRAPGSPLKSPLHLAKFALSRSQGHRLLTSPDGNCWRVRGIIPECPPQEWHVCVCLPFSAIQRLVGSN